MAQRDKRDVEAALEAKGFQRDERHHHYFIFYSSSGKKSAIRTRTSHGSKAKTISSGLMAQMSRQCKLTSAQFLNLIDCPLSREEYERLLTDSERL